MYRAPGGGLCSRAPSGGLGIVPPVEVFVSVPPVEVFVSCPRRRSWSAPPRRACPCLRGGLCLLWRQPAERARGRNVPCTRPKRYGGAGLVSAPPCSLALAVRQRQLAPDKSLLRLAPESVADRSERSFRVYCLDSRAQVIGNGSGLSAVPAFPAGALRSIYRPASKVRLDPAHKKAREFLQQAAAGHELGCCWGRESGAQTAPPAKTRR